MNPPSPNNLSPKSLSLAQLIAEYTAAQRYSMALVGGLTSDQVFWRPDSNSSAMAWHLGHQGAVNHYMVRNLTAAEVSFNTEFDRVFDSATPEPGRGDLPPLDEITDYRQTIAASTTSIIDRIDRGDVGAPKQLRLIAQGLMVAVINHEYQHAKWIGEGRALFTGEPAPAPTSTYLVDVEGYAMVGMG